MFMPNVADKITVTLMPKISVLCFLKCTLVYGLAISNTFDVISIISAGIVLFQRLLKTILEVLTPMLFGMLAQVGV